MLVPILEKQPSEDRLFDMDFSSILKSDETITSVISVTQENQGNVTGSSDLTLVANSYSGAVVQVNISGGTDLEDYKVTIKISTSVNSVIEGEGMMRVRDA